MEIGTYYLIVGLPPLILSAVEHGLRGTPVAAKLVVGIALAWALMTAIPTTLIGHDSQAQAVVSTVIVFGINLAVAFSGAFVGAILGRITQRLFRR